MIILKNVDSSWSNILSPTISNNVLWLKLIEFDNGRNIPKLIELFKVFSIDLNSIKMIYLGTLPNEETQNFYKEQGIIMFPREINMSILDPENYDFLWRATIGLICRVIAGRDKAIIWLFDNYKFLPKNKIIIDKYSDNELEDIPIGNFNYCTYLNSHLETHNKLNRINKLLKMQREKEIVWM